MPSDSTQQASGEGRTQTPMGDRDTVYDATDSGAPGGAAHAPTMLAPRQVFAGRFHVVRPLGEGGMGAVYLARDQRLGRDVAIKTMRLRHRADEANQDWLQTFRREATTIGQLQHPNVVTLHDFGVDQGVPYLVLEYLRGRTLSEVLADGPLDSSVAVELARQLTDALAHAHDAGVLHRDLKPGNLFVTAGDRLKVMDFGVSFLRADWDHLARRMGRDARAVQDELGSTPLSAGTPLFMAPEQMLGWEQDERVDVWSFGCVLYMMLTGRPPFSSTEAMATMQAPDYSHIDVGVADLIRGCLLHEPEERISGAREVRRRLDELDYSASAGSQTTPAPRALRRPTDVFIGRNQELDVLIDAVREPGLVTLLGPGGCGKTRLALEFGHAHRDAFDRVVFADLADARGVDQILVALADALRVPLSASDPIHQLSHVLAGQGRALVILDNFEQVTAFAEETLGCWLERAVRATFLVTSRHRLELGQERVVTLAPLTLPSSAQVQRIQASDAVRLFVVRAQVARPEFELSVENASDVAELVRALDGLPLAIELAAARSRILTPRQMVERLRNRFALLRGKRRDVSARQATLLGAIEWSWELLTDWERSTLEQASVFEGSFSLEAAESVVDLSSWSRAPFVMDAIEGLVDKSLVRLAPGSGYDARFELLVSIQAFAQAQLASRAAPALVSEPATLRRHVEFFGQLGEESSILKLHRHGGQERYAALREDFENLIAAVDRGLALGELTSAGRAYRAASQILILRGPLNTAVKLGDRLLAAGGLPDRLRAFIMVSQIAALLRLGEPGACTELSHEVRRIGQALEEPRLVGLAYSSLAASAYRSGELEEARELFGQSVAYSERAQDVRTLANAKGNLGMLESAQGNVERADSLIEAAVSAARSAGDVRTELGWRKNRAIHWMRHGREEEAIEEFKATLPLARRLDDRAGEAISIGTLGVLEGGERARARFEEAARLMKEYGDMRWQGVWIRELANLEREQGQLEAARARFAVAEEMIRTFAGAFDLASLLARRGLLDLAQGRADEARAALDEAEGMAQTSGWSAESVIGKEIEALRSALQDRSLGA